MHTTDVERWLKARPFEPFALHLTTGDRIEVRHPETCFLLRNSLLVVYARGHRLDAWSNVSLFHIVKIEPVDGKPEAQTGGNGQE